MRIRASSRHSARAARHVAALALSAAVILIAGGRARSQDCPTTFGAADAGEVDEFGWSVALYEGVAAIGNLDGNGTSAGAAYVVDLRTRTQRYKLVEPGPVDSSLFGWSVAVGSDHVAVGAPDLGNDRGGVVYVFDVATGAFLHTLRASDAAADSLFGYSVAISGDMLVVGAPSAGRAGAAYVFDLAAGDEIRRLSGRGAGGGADFGHAVGIDGSKVVVGAPSDRTTKTRWAGAAYVFDVPTGRQRRRLVPSSSHSASFGYSIAVSGATVLVGAPTDDERGAIAGAAYLFDAVSGRETRELILDEGAANDFFGVSVALRGNFAVVGAHVQERRQLAGLAYVFDPRTGERIAAVPGRLRAPGDRFGSSLALDDDWLLAGVPFDDARGRDAGEIELFRLDDLPGTPVVLEPEPAVTTLRYEFTFPGFGTFVFERQIVGRIVAEIPLDCLPPKSFGLTALELRPENAEPPITIAPGVTITLNEPGVELLDAGPPSPVGPDGSFAQEVRVRLLGSVQYTLPTTGGSIDMSQTEPLSFAFTGTLDNSGAALTLDAVVPPTSGVIDLGLGDANPTYTVSGIVAATRVKPAFASATPSETLKARVDLDFDRDASDRTKFSGRFLRSMPPNLGGGTSGVLRIGAYRADVTLDAKGRTPKGSATAIKLKVKKKKAKFKVSVRKADLRAALAALPAADGLPRAIPWSLTLTDGWTIHGLLTMDGKDKLRSAAGGTLARATLNMRKRKPGL